MNSESFLDERFEQWLSSGWLSKQVKEKLQNFSLHLDEIRGTLKLFSCSTFVVYGISTMPIH